MIFSNFRHVFILVHIILMCKVNIYNVDVIKVVYTYLIIQMKLPRPKQVKSFKFQK